MGLRLLAYNMFIHKWINLPPYPFWLKVIITTATWQVRYFSKLLVVPFHHGKLDGLPVDGMVFVHWSTCLGAFMQHRLPRHLQRFNRTVAIKGADSNA